LDIPGGNFYFTSDRAGTTSGRIKNVSELDHLANGILNRMGNIYRIPAEKLRLNVFGEI
jgi:hypothetical protein